MREHERVLQIGYTTNFPNVSFSIQSKFVRENKLGVTQINKLGNL